MQAEPLEECSICLCDMAPGSDFVTSCQHSFHRYGSEEEEEEEVGLSGWWVVEVDSVPC